MADDLDALRARFYDDEPFAANDASAQPPIARRRTQKQASFVERALNAPDDDGDVAMAVDPLPAPSRGLFTPRAPESDWQRLLRAWQDERHAPDILPAQDGLLTRVLDQIRRQSDDAKALRGDVRLSGEEHYMTMLVQTEVERVKFVVRSYVRTRLFKIEQYAGYITSNPDVQTRLSQAELRHAQRYAELVVSQFRTSVLDHLPETQQGLDDDVPTMPSMITAPDKERPVFIHARQDCEPIQLPDGTRFEIAAGSIHLMRYHTVENLLARGEVELV